MRLKFYIYAPPYNSTSGGIIALHRLAHNLTLLGEEAILVSNSKHPDWLGKIQHDSEPRDPNGVAIYPEIACGNPYEMKTVVRWILNTPGVMGGDGVFEPTDLVYKYANYFKAPDETKVKGELRALDLKLDLYFDQDMHQPGKTCYMVRKGLRKTLNEHPGDAICIDNYGELGGDTYLASIFNKCETFISYDHANFATVHAALCGCNVIVIPDGEFTKKQWKDKFPYFSYGIAYGKDDLQWSIDTRGKVRDNLLKLEEETILQTKQLTNDCYQSRISQHIER